jgi:hypothetical protein
LRENRRSRKARMQQGPTEEPGSKPKGGGNPRKKRQEKDRGTRGSRKPGTTCQRQGNRKKEDQYQERKEIAGKTPEGIQHTSRTQNQKRREKEETR